MERIKSTDEYKVGLSDYAQDSYGDFVVVEIERMNEIVDKDGKWVSVAPELEKMFFIQRKLVMSNR